jgi:hypothetical protein
MRSRIAIGTTVATIVLGSVIVRSMFQAPAVRSVDEKILREYAGVYQWGFRVSPDVGGIQRIRQAESRGF